MTATMNDAVRMVKLGDNLMVPIDHPRLTGDWRGRWDRAQSKAANGEDMRGTISMLVREALAAIGPEVLLRAAHRAPMSVLNIGVADNTARMTDLSEAAARYADKEKKKEGIKEGAGRGK